MPVLTAAACVPSEACPATPFPTATALCNPLTSSGGVNDLYIIPCDQVLSEVNLLDTAWWEALVAGDSPGTSFLGNIGRGLGSITKKTDKKDRLSSSQVESVISTTWALKYVLKTFDKSADKITHEQVNALIASSKNYQLIARMCDGDNTVLPIGPFATSDFNWIVPDNFEELQTIELELSWIETGLPKTYDVTGLSAVVPKA
jgi:hypothetical protein